MFEICSDSYERPDVNFMVYSKSNHLLYAGCGNNTIYIISLEGGKIQRSLEGHEDYVHSISVMYENEKI